MVTYLFTLFYSQIRYLNLSFSFWKTKANGAVASCLVFLLAHWVEAAGRLIDSTRFLLPSNDCQPKDKTSCGISEPALGGIFPRGVVSAFFGTSRLPCCTFVFFAPGMPVRVIVGCCTTLAPCTSGGSRSEARTSSSAAFAVAARTWQED